MNAFLTVAAIHLLAVASPGPDFAIILKHGISQSRSTVRWTALGIAAGIMVHTTYSLVGIGLLISQSILLFSIIKWIGAAYLLYLGIHALRTKPNNLTNERAHEPEHVSPQKAVLSGFLCNVLNPKATLFFLALFTQVIDPTTSLTMHILYGLYMAIATYVWFSSLGSILTLTWIRARMNSIHVWLERIMGAALIALGLKVAMQTQEN